MPCPLCVPHIDSKETHLAGLPVISHTAGEGAGGAFWGCSHTGISMFFTSRKVCRAGKHPNALRRMLEQQAHSDRSALSDVLAIAASTRCAAEGSKQTSHWSR